MTTTAKIAGKGCKGTGITESLAQQLANNLGKTIIAIVELTAEARSENRDGDEQVTLKIGTIELPPEATNGAEHVRELNQLFHYERKLIEEGPGFTFEGDGPEPKVADVLAEGQRHRPHPYIASTLSTDDDATCDVCGLTETTPLHHAQARLADPFTVPEDDQDDDEPDLP